MSKFRKTHSGSLHVVGIYLRHLAIVKTSSSLVLPPCEQRSSDAGVGLEQSASWRLERRYASN